MNLKYVVVQDKGGGGGGSFLLLHSLYIIDLIFSLRDSGYGCEIGSEYCGVINYVDDIAFISGSQVKMQFMLDICYNYWMSFSMILFLMVRNRNLYGLVANGIKKLSN